MSIDEEFCIYHRSSDEKEQRFAQIIGCIEDILMSPDFYQKQEQFLNEHWQHFDNKDENKLIYTDIFNKYITNIERFFEMEIEKNIPDFNMTILEQELVQRKHELDGEILELLTTFTDFIAFKTMVLDFKAMKEGLRDFSKGITISKYC